MKRRASARGRAGIAADHTPDRGDIVWLDLDPQAGREQSGRRPCLVLSPSAYNSRTGLAVFCAITNQRKGYAFEVLLPAGLQTSGVVLADHIKSLDWRARHLAFRERIDDSLVREVLDMTLTLLYPGENDAHMKSNGAPG